MAKIYLISKSNTSFARRLSPDGFVQGFANALSRLGNEVTCIITNNLPDWLVKDYILSHTPNLIISFNNQGVSEELLRKTDIPFFLFCSDNIPFIRCPHLVSSFPTRYFVLHHSSETLSQFCQAFPDFPSEHHIVFGHASDLRARKYEQDISVSFIGSMGNWDKSSVRYFQKMSEKVIKAPQLYPYDINELKEQYLQKLDEFIQNPLTPPINNLPLWEKITNTNFSQSLTLTATCQKRFEILNQLTDIGLKIFSYPEGMADVLSYSKELFKCYDFSLSVTLEDSEKNFNRSKISLNLPHAQAITGFSWRVCDILASNACLVSDKRKDLEELMKPYIKLPMYETAAEAKELIKKLLKDDVWRQDIVSASQKMIDENCRFERKIMDIQNVTGIKMALPQAISPDIQYLSSDTFINMISAKPKRADRGGVLAKVEIQNMETLRHEAA